MSGGDGPRGADWGDRVGGLRGVAWGHLRDADEDVGVPRGARAMSGGDGPRGADWGDRVGGLRGVAWGPSVETGASVPSYSGGFAALLVVSSLDLRWRIATQTVNPFGYDWRVRHIR